MTNFIYLDEESKDEPVINTVQARQPKRRHQFIDEAAQEAQVFQDNKNQGIADEATRQLNMNKERIITGDLSTDERSFFKRTIDTLKYGAESKLNNYSDSVDGFRKRMDDAEFSTFAKTALPIAASVVTPAGWAYQALAAAGGGGLAQLYENWEKGAEAKTEDVGKQAFKEGLTSAAVDTAIHIITHAPRGSQKVLAKIAKPVLDTEAAKRTALFLKSRLKNSMEAFDQNIAKSTEFLVKRADARFSAVSDTLLLVEESIKRNKTRIAKDISAPMKAMERFVGRQYDQILKPKSQGGFADIPVNVDQEVDFLVDLLKPNLKGVKTQKAKIAKILNNFDFNVKKMASKTSGKKKALKLANKEEVVFMDAHKLKQHVSQLKHSISTGNDSVAKSIIKPLDQVLDSLRFKLENVSGGSYKKANAHFRQMMDDMKYVTPKSGEISRASGLKGLRENFKETISAIVKEGSESGDEIFSAVNKKIDATMVEITMLKQSGNPKLAAAGAQLESRIKNLATTANQKKMLENSITEMKKINYKEDEFIKMKELLKETTKDNINRELDAAKDIIARNSENYSMDILSLSMLRSGVANFLPSILLKPSAALVGLASIKKYSPVAAKVLAEQIELIIRWSNKKTTKINSTQRRALRLFLKRLVMTGDDTNE